MWNNHFIECLLQYCIIARINGWGMMMTRRKKWIANRNMKPNKRIRRRRTQPKNDVVFKGNGTRVPSLIQLFMKLILTYEMNEQEMKQTMMSERIHFKLTYKIVIENIKNENKRAESDT